MAADDDSADKSHEPTQKKLDDARKKGEIARSTDVNVALTYFGAWLFMVGIGASQIQTFGSAMQSLLSDAFVMDREVLQGAGAAFLGGYFYQIGLPLALFAGIPAALILLSLLAQRGLLFTGSKLQPKLSRVSVLQNAKNKFGRNGLFEFAKSFVKLLIFSVCLGLFLYWNFDTLIGSARIEARLSILKIFRMISQFMALAVLVSASIAAVDLFWQIQEHQRKNRMSHKELRDESKDTEGDPHLKQARRTKAQEIAMNQMMADVPSADVVIVNPTHYAVALAWSGTRHEAPKCLAKGVDEVALRIREIAKQEGIAIHSDPPTARALHAIVNIGAEIEPEHYAAVAAAIRFAEELKRKKRK